MGEYQDSEKEDNPVFTVADGIIWLTQSVERNSVVRKLQVVKIRGQAPIPGLQTFRITGNGVQVFPRMPVPKDISVKDQVKIAHSPPPGCPWECPSWIGCWAEASPPDRPYWSPAHRGPGKTIMSMQFILEGIKQQEHGLIAVFEKRPSDYLKSNP